MPGTDRRLRLVRRLREDGRASVAVLARDLGVTPSTIRRDLARLADEGTLVRTYGGATLAGAGSPLPRRTDASAAAKRAIGAAAASLVEDGQTIAISSGSTTLEMARRLVDRRLTVITNAIDVASVLLDCDGIELVVLGGVVRPRMHSMLGHLAELALRELRADTLFMGIGAVDLTDRALRRSARTCVVLADASKFAQVAPAFVFGLGEIDVVVTDAGTDPADIVALQAHGVRVVVAPPHASIAPAGAPKGAQPVP
jgi:DeoR/GlpR family transcriptional regulator of sugar metabolism